MKTFQSGQKVWLFHSADLPLGEGVIKSVSPAGAIIRVTLANGSDVRLPERDHWRLRDEVEAQKHNALLPEKRAYKEARDSYRQVAGHLEALMGRFLGCSTPEATTIYKRAAVLLGEVVANLKQPEGK